MLVALLLGQHRQTLHTFSDILRGDVKQFFISYSKPHQAVSPDTVSRWIKTTLVAAGIDTSKYSAHSTRSASTSAAKEHSNSITTIMKSAGWSQESTFSKFYSKLVKPQEIFGAELKAVCGGN